VVVDYEYLHSTSMDSPVPVPVVQFQAPDGRLVTASSDVAGMGAPRKGDRVTVLFDPDRPKQVHIDSGASDEPDIVDKIGGVGLPRFDGQGWWLGQAACVRASLRVAVSNSSGVM
jgi:hypothetical protein